MLILQVSHRLQQTRTQHCQDIIYHNSATLNVLACFDVGDKGSSENGQSVGRACFVASHNDRELCNVTKQEEHVTIVARAGELTM